MCYIICSKGFQQVCPCHKQKKGIQKAYIPWNSQGFFAHRLEPFLLSKPRLSKSGEY